MENSRVGAIILRVHGDVAGPNDLRVLMKAIVENENLRRRCKSIGNLARDIPERDRQSYAELCLLILYAWAPPNEITEPGTAAKFSHICKRPLRGSPWADHSWTADGDIYVSGTLEDVFVALEGLWNVPGHLAKRT